MSSMAVRTAINTALTTFAAAEGVIHYPTINQIPSRPTDVLWLTADYNAEYTEKRCFSGVKRAEFGTIDVVVSGKAGIGFAAVIQLADKVEAYLLNYTGPDVEITSSVPPNDLNDGDARHYFSVEVTFSYTHEVN